MIKDFAGVIAELIKKLKLFSFIDTNGLFDFNYYDSSFFRLKTINFY